MKLAPILLCTALLAVAGCGGSDESDSSSESTSTPAPATGSGGGGGGAATKSVTATIKDFNFEPKAATVAAGGTITWTNEDSANHNVVFDDKSVKGISNLRQDQSGEVTFDKAGSYDYVCSYHPGMEGTVEVQ
jgi:plastocyanin